MYLMRFDNVKRLMRYFILVGLVLGLCLGGAVGQFGYDPSAVYCGDGTEDAVEEDSLGSGGSGGSGGMGTTLAAPKFGTKVMSDDRDEGRLLEDFEFVAGPGLRLRQLPVSIGWWDIGPNQLLFDEGDVLYLHIGTAAGIRPNDIRLTPFGLYPAGSKVTASDPDMGQLLTFAFGSPFLPEIVYADVGGVMGQYDLEDTVYIKTVLPFVPAQAGFAQLATGDIRLTSAAGHPAGSRVRDFDADNGAFVRLLHGPVPTFDTWGFFDRGVVRFYNANGNLYMGPPAGNAIVTPSPSIYDYPDGVYLDVSHVSVGFRDFGHVTPGAIRLNN